MTDTYTLAEIVESAAAFLECDGDASFTPTYSGRCMHGVQCVGIVHDVSDLRVAHAIIQAATERGMDAYDALDALDTLARDARNDSMGRSAIIYFPSVAPTDEQRDDARAHGDL